MRKKSKFLYCLTPLVFFLLLLLLVLPGCEKKSSPKETTEKAKSVVIKPEEINLKETKLAAIPEDYDKWDNISFSADGQQVSYRAVKKGKHGVVINDKAGAFYEAINDLIVFSPDRKKVAYDGKRGGKEYLVVDNREVKPYDDVAPGPFSPDGRLVACQVEGKKDKKWFVVVSNGEKEIYRSQAYPDTFRYPIFSPDGRLLVFELGEKNKKRIVFFLDVVANKKIKERLCAGCDMVGKFSFSSDSSRVIYEVKKEGKSFLVLLDFALNAVDSTLREERMIELPYTSTGQLVLSPEGKKIAYVANKEGKHFLVESLWESPAQGKERGPYEGVAQAIFSPDLTTVVYRAMKNGKWRIVAGGKEGAIYDSIGEDAVFSIDGAKIAYPAMKKGKWVIVLSSMAKPDVVREGLAYDRVVSPVFGPDGKYIVCRARTGTMEKPKRFIVIADAETGRVIKEGPAHDEVWPPVWSADGKAAAYGARKGKELWWKVEKLNK